MSASWTSIKAGTLALLATHRGPMTEEQILRGLHLSRCQMLDVRLVLRALVTEGRVEELLGGRYRLMKA